MRNDIYKLAIYNSSIGFASIQYIKNEHEKADDYKILDINPYFVCLSGITHAEINKTFSEISQIFLGPRISTIKEVAISGKSVSFEEYSEPMKRWFKVDAFSTEKNIATLLYTDITNEKLLNLNVNLLTEISGQKQAEAQMRYMTNRLSTLINHLPGGILLETPERKILQTNQNFCDYFGIPYPPESLIGSDCAQASEMVKTLFVDADGFIPRIEKILLAKKAVFNDELELVDGRVLHRDYIPIHTENNEFENLWYYRDITEMKKSEAALQNLSALQKIIMDISSQYINIPPSEIENAVNRSLKELGQFVEADRTYIFEYDWDKNICINTHEWCDEGIGPQMEELLAVPLDALPQWVEVHKKGQTLYIPDVFALEKENSVRQILEPQEIKSLITIPMMAENECIGFIGFDSVKKHHNYSQKEESLLTVFSKMLVNVKKRAALQNNLIEEKRKAELANTAKSEFLANMSHEIRTPMNAILGFSEALYSEVNTAKHKNMLKSILSSGNLLLSLLNDILDLSKIEAGKMEIVPQPVDIEDIINEIKLLFLEKASKKGIEINILKSKSFNPQLLLDEMRIKQVLFNLVGNALKFTHRGYVNITLDFIKNKKENTGTLIINVSDTGIGIPTSQQEIIFEAFRQQSGQSNRNYEGVGLGLAITKRLIEKMNGTIAVFSEEKKGSTFTVEINNVEVYKENIKRITKITEPLNIEFKRSVLLIIDDVKSNIEAVESLLSNTNIHLISCNSGQNIIEVLSRQVPDVILLDLRMPMIDGYEVAKIIKENQTFKKIPIIAYTASVMNGEKIKNSGNFSSILYKPVHKKELYKALMMFLPYYAVDCNENSNKIGFFDTFDVLPENISGILYSLQEVYMPVWQTIKDQLILYQIENFASSLKDFAENHNFSQLKQYTEKMLEYLEAIDLESLKESLSDFPKILTIIQNKTKK